MTSPRFWRSVLSTSEPLILGFDTSAAHCAAALVCGDRLLAHRHEEMGRGQAERLMPLIAEVMAEAGAALDDLDALAVGTGPGNFTGLRIAVAAARGLALALGRPAIGVPSHEAMAEGLQRPLLVSIDARRGRLYLQSFGEDRRGPELVEAVDPSWATPGSGVTGHAAGDLADRFGLRAVAATPPAPGVARAAMRRFRAAPPGTNWPRPAPLYLRPADAAPSSEAPMVLLP